MNKIIMLCSLIMFSFSSYGQEKFQPEELKNVRKNNYQIELGLNSLSSIWRGTTSGSILLKRKINFGDLVEVNALKFLRTYFSADTQINFTDDPTLAPGDTTDIEFHPADQINFTVGLGYEVQKKGKFLVHYYGFDLFSQFYKTDDDIFNGRFGGVIVNQVGTTDRYIRTLKVGVVPFMGVKYYFTKHFSVGIETGIQLYWFNTKFTELEIEQQTMDNQFVNVLVEREPVKSNGIGVKFSGARFITIGYTF